MSAVVASYGLGLLKPTGLSAKEPLPAPIFVAFHVAFIGNDEVAAFADVACTPSIFLTIVTVTSEAGIVPENRDTLSKRKPFPAVPGAAVPPVRKMRSSVVRGVCSAAASLSKR